jgi:hypothetical protein
LAAKFLPCPHVNQFLISNIPLLPQLLGSSWPLTLSTFVLRIKGLESKACAIGLVLRLWLWDGGLPLEPRWLLKRCGNGSRTMMNLDVGGVQSDISGCASYRAFNSPAQKDLGSDLDTRQTTTKQRTQLMR